MTTISTHSGSPLWVVGASVGAMLTLLTVIVNELPAPAGETPSKIDTAPLWAGPCVGSVFGLAWSGSLAMTLHHVMPSNKAKVALSLFGAGMGAYLGHNPAPIDVIGKGLMWIGDGIQSVTDFFIK